MTKHEVPRTSVMKFFDPSQRNFVQASSRQGGYNQAKISSSPMFLVKRLRFQDSVRKGAAHPYFRREPHLVGCVAGWRYVPSQRLSLISDDVASLVGQTIHSHLSFKNIRKSLLVKDLSVPLNVFCHKSLSFSILFSIVSKIVSNSIYFQKIRNSIYNFIIVPVVADSS